MFEVRAYSLMDDDWELRDRQLETAAGRESDFSGASCTPDSCGRRDHGWDVSSFLDAMSLKAKLETVPGVTVTIREK